MGLSRLRSLLIGWLVSKQDTSREKDRGGKGGGGGRRQEKVGASTYREIQSKEKVEKLEPGKK